ncbi:hypothetical protein ELQ39_15735 [Streptomyces sp. GB4-14]|uniref:hypothetical protein n=1 Tax=Streptomyces sp. GB4-14 TaxID=2498703 RepID=UPI001F5E5FE8|nr:hypothetical protein [Streptomyces sp. GB4-14]
MSSSALPAFDADARTISIPNTATYADAMTVVRAILRGLVVDQPAFGAVCWCGEPVDVGVLPLIPQQKMSEQVVRHGA